jgi:tetratricopeptide (TPR) repeat protein
MVMPEQKPSKQQLVLISAGLVLLILAAFEPLRHNEFVSYDDYEYITANPHIKSGFTSPSVAWAFTSGYAANWHPLTWLSHMLDIELFGLNPLGHHLHNLFLHTLNTVLLFWLLHSMTGAVWRSAFVAMAFGIHPLHVESVAWTAERKDVLCALFWMLTIAAYLYYARRGGILRYLLVVSCFALGLMAKPMLVTLPIVLLLLDFWPLGRVQKNTTQTSRHSATINKTVEKKYRSASIAYLVTEKIPLFILTFVSCIITYSVQQHGGSVLAGSPSTHHLMNVIINYISYPCKIFWPFNLAVLYPYPLYRPSAWYLILASLALILWSGFVVSRHAKNPYLITGWFWYVVSLIPVIGIVQAGAQAVADRYSYLPSIGIFLILSWVTAQWSATWRYQKAILGTIGGLLTIAMAVCTHTQVTCWKNSMVLYEHALAVTKNNYVMHCNIGRILGEQNRLDEAAEHIRKALQLWPDYPAANDRMAMILIKRGQFDKAMEYLQKVLKTSPTYTEAYYHMGIVFAAQGNRDEAIRSYQQAIRLNSDDFLSFNSLGVLKAQQGLRKEAAECFRRSIQVNPAYAEAWRNLGLTQQMQNQLTDAVASYHTALKNDPNDYRSYYNLARSLQSMGKPREAAGFYRQALQLDPNLTTAMNNLAWILATTSDNQIRNPVEAITLSQKACQLTDSNDVLVLDTLAAAYAAANQFKEAIETAQKAINLDRKSVV